jgi:hypothetical protein
LLRDPFRTAMVVGVWWVLGVDLGINHLMMCVFHA